MNLDHPLGPTNALATNALVLKALDKTMQSLFLLCFACFAFVSKHYKSKFMHNGLFTWSVAKNSRNICEKFAKNLRNICEIFAKNLRKIREKFAKNSQNLQNICEKFVKKSGKIQEC